MPLAAGRISSKTGDAARRSRRKTPAAPATPPIAASSRNRRRDTPRPGIRRVVKSALSIRGRHRASVFIVAGRSDEPQPRSLRRRRMAPEAMVPSGPAGILRPMGASGALTERGSRSSHSSTGRGKSTLAIVIPLYNESAGLEQLFERLRSVLDDLRDLESQVIYVNDGSTDGSLEIMLAQQSRDQRFTVIDVARKCQQAAIAAGLAPRRQMPRVEWTATRQDSRTDCRDGRVLARGRRSRARAAAHAARAWATALVIRPVLQADRLACRLPDSRARGRLRAVGPQGPRRAEPAAGEESLPAGPAGVGRLRSACRLLRPRLARLGGAETELRPAAALCARRRLQLLVQAAPADGGSGRRDLGPWDSCSPAGS